MPEHEATRCCVEHCNQVVPRFRIFKGWIKTRGGDYYCPKHSDEGQKAVAFDRNDLRHNPQCPLVKASANLSGFSFGGGFTFGGVSKDVNQYPCRDCSRRNWVCT